MSETTAKHVPAREAICPQAGDVLLQAGRGGQWLFFSSPVAVYTARSIEDVIPVMEQAEAALAEGLFVAGLVAYEAASAFDDAILTHSNSTLPLCWFAAYKEARPVAPPTGGQACHPATWTPSQDRPDFAQTLAKIKTYIEQGDTYQVNHTFRLQAEAPPDAFALFGNLLKSQPDGYSAYLHTEDTIVCSLSPELFYRREGNRIDCQPMKGTSPRGRTLEDDERILRALQGSEKNRAENVMVVDMVRNDLGRIARPGSVQVDRLFDIHRFPTLFQMTSSISAETDVGLLDTFRALFPCASITGAPKIRTAEIIQELESTPRGIYTGAIGYATPDGNQQFNVAIRTLEIHPSRSTAIYGTGSGIVWDSDADEEYKECCTKALVLRETVPPFSLLETLRWEPNAGYFFLHQHLERVTDSATYFDIPLDPDALLQQLADYATSIQGDEAMRVRLLIHAEGRFDLESYSMGCAPFAASPKEADASGQQVRAGLATDPVPSTNRFLYHKTTYRPMYDDAVSTTPEVEEVILFNEASEVTETTIGNVVIKRGTGWVTPPVSCGLLAGTYRAVLLKEGSVAEDIIPLQEIQQASEIYRVNSVRGWQRLKLCLA